MRIYCEVMVVRRSTRAQIQMGEVIIVMIIFFMLLGFGILFYTQFAAGTAQQTVREVDRANLAEVAKIVGTLPEIHCSYAGDLDFTCIDILRASIFSAHVYDGDDVLQYSEVFHGYSARVQCIYPRPCTTIGINDYILFDYTDPDGESSVPFFIPINILDPVTDTKGYGLLVVTQVT